MLLLLYFDWWLNNQSIGDLNLNIQMIIDSSCSIDDKCIQDKSIIKLNL